MDQEKETLYKSKHQRWALFRLSVIGELLNSPSEKGLLGKKIADIAAKSWKHPITKKDYKISFTTVERWYYKALHSPTDEYAALRSKTRSDVGVTRTVNSQLEGLIAKQYAEYPYFNRRLHYDNLKAFISKNPVDVVLPSYATLNRYMTLKGFRKTKPPRKNNTIASIASMQAFCEKETRSYEVSCVNELWHFDGHHCKIEVLTDKGEWIKPVAIAYIDDHSRLCAHIQWYLGETGENITHSLIQAMLKRGLPRGLYADNGKAEFCQEVICGLERLGIAYKHTRAYSPHMNAKVENFWGQIESRLIMMINGYKNVTLKQLNDWTQAYVEMDYHRKVHREINDTPLNRYINGHSLSRPTPDQETLRQHFYITAHKTQRLSDGTVSIQGVRYEVPSRFKHQTKLYVKYARWDMSHVYIIDYRTGDPIARIYPINKEANAYSSRREIEDPVIVSPSIDKETLPSYLTSLIERYDAMGLLPAYIPQENN